MIIPKTLWPLYAFGSTVKPTVRVAIGTTVVIITGRLSSKASVKIRSVTTILPTGVTRGEQGNKPEEKLKINHIQTSFASVL